MGRVGDSLLVDVVASGSSVRLAVEVGLVEVYKVVVDLVEHLQSGGRSAAL